MLDKAFSRSLTIVANAEPLDPDMVGLLAGAVVPNTPRPAVV